MINWTTVRLIIKCISHAIYIFIPCHALFPNYIILFVVLGCWVCEIHRDVHLSLPLVFFLVWYHELLVQLRQADHDYCCFMWFVSPWLDWVRTGTYQPLIFSTGRNGTLTFMLSPRWASPARKHLYHWWWMCTIIWDVSTWSLLRFAHLNYWVQALKDYWYKIHFVFLATYIHKS